MTRPKTFLTCCLFVVVLSVAFLGQETKDRRTTRIKGTVVAEYRNFGHFCYHVCSLSLIIKLDKSEPAKYVVVAVQYMNVYSAPRNGMPIQLVEKAARWQFQALENSELSSLEKYMTFIDMNGKDVTEKTAIPVWYLLKGAENEKLPFGEALLHYSVDVGNFKLLK